nr:unnamed protein product [Callosobruchus analis]
MKVEVPKTSCELHKMPSINMGKRATDRQNKGESRALLTLSNNQSSGTCYFIDCVINDEPIRGFVDSGCAAVTIRQSDAVKLHLQAEPSLVRLCGYAGTSVVVRSESHHKFDNGFSFCYFDALIAPHNVQEVPVILDQPFLNNGNTVVVRGQQIRHFNQTSVDIMNIDDFLSVKVQLVVKETTVIPPNFVGHISLSELENVKDVSTDLCYRNWNNIFVLSYPAL